MIVTFVYLLHLIILGMQLNSYWLLLFIGTSNRTHANLQTTITQ